MKEKLNLAFSEKSLPRAINYIFIAPLSYIYRYKHPQDNTDYRFSIKIYILYIKSSSSYSHLCRFIIITASKGGVESGSAKVDVKKISCDVTNCDSCGICYLGLQSGWAWFSLRFRSGWASNSSNRVRPVAIGRIVWTLPPWTTSELTLIYKEEK